MGASRVPADTDADGWLTRVEDPEDGTPELSYRDANGLLASFRRPGAGTSRFEYEDDGRLKSDVDPDGPTKTLTRSYDGDRQDVTIVQIDPAEARQKALNTYNDLLRDRRPAMYGG